MQDNNLPKVLVPIFKKIFNMIHLIECQERSEQTGAVQAMLFIDLPAAGEVGRLRFVTNGRKIGQGVGAGTGVLVVDDGTNWNRQSDDTPVLS